VRRCAVLSCARSAVHFSAVLCCAVLCCAVLCCAVLCSPTAAQHVPWRGLLYRGSSSSLLMTLMGELQSDSSPARAVARGTVEGLQLAAVDGAEGGVAAAEGADGGGCSPTAAQHMPWRGAQCGGSYLLLPMALMGRGRSPTAAQHMPWRGAL